MTLLKLIASRKVENSTFFFLLSYVKNFFFIQKDVTFPFFYFDNND